MKQKIMLKIAILVGFFMLIFAIGLINNKVYAALPEGSLKITIDINKESDKSLYYFKNIEYKIKHTDENTEKLNNEFAEANGVTVTNRNRL